MAKQDLYALLGVKPDATDAAIEAAYQGACDALHQGPDSHGADAQNRLKFLRFAHETLMHPGRRAAYNASLRKPVAPVAEPAPRTGAKVALPPRLMVVLIGAGVAALATTWYMRAGPGKAAPQAAAVAPVREAAQASAVGEAAASVGAETLFERHAQSIVVIDGLNSESKSILQGSGVAVADQRVITNCHVAKSAASIVVKQGDKRYPATLIRVDAEPSHDLCLLAVPSLHVPPIVLASIESVKVGQRVFALGAPNGLELTLSEGIVSSLRQHHDSSFIQTTASISPGSSGGGLLNDQGALVGITTFQHSKGQNLNFAVPVDWVAKLLDQKESLAVLGPESLGDLLGKWRCDSNKEKEQIVYQFGRDGAFSMMRPESPKVAIKGSYSIMGNHTLVLKSAEAEPPEVYVQIMALGGSAMQITSPFYDEGQTYSCAKTGAP